MIKGLACVFDPETRLFSQQLLRASMKEKSRSALLVSVIHLWLVPWIPCTKGQCHQWFLSQRAFNTLSTSQPDVLCCHCLPPDSLVYRQMGELWTLFEFACLLYLTCNMVLDMDGSISRFLLCIMIFSISRLYGIKFSTNWTEKYCWPKLPRHLG